MSMLYGADGKPLKTAPRKRTAPEGEPAIETTHAENLAARKFIAFLLGDIGYQIQRMSTDTKVSRQEFDRTKSGAVLIAKYLTEQVKELDRVIASIEPTKAVN